MAVMFIVVNVKRIIYIPITLAYKISELVDKISPKIGEKTAIITEECEEYISEFLLIKLLDQFITNCTCYMVSLTEDAKISDVFNQYVSKFIEDNTDIVQQNIDRDKLESLPSSNLIQASAICSKKIIKDKITVLYLCDPRKNPIEEFEKIVHWAKKTEINIVLPYWPGWSSKKTGFSPNNPFPRSPMIYASVRLILDWLLSPEQENGYGIQPSNLIIVSDGMACSYMSVIASNRSARQDKLKRSKLVFINPEGFLQPEESGIMNAIKFNISSEINQYDLIFAEELPYIETDVLMISDPNKKESDKLCESMERITSHMKKDKESWCVEPDRLGYNVKHERRSSPIIDWVLDICHILSEKDIIFLVDNKSGEEMPLSTLNIFEISGITDKVANKEAMLLFQ